MVKEVDKLKKVRGTSYSFAIEIYWKRSHDIKSIYYYRDYIIMKSIVILVYMLSCWVISTGYGDMIMIFYWDRHDTTLYDYNSYKSGLR